jgi:hypothetical protein
MSISTVLIVLGLLDLELWGEIKIRRTGMNGCSEEKDASRRQAKLES